MTFALIRLNPLSLVRELDATTNCKSDHAIVPIVQEDQPEYNAATHKLVATTTVGVDQVTKGWSVVALTTKEVAEKELTDGYTVSPEGFVLSATNQSQINFTKLVTLMNQLLAANQITLQTNQQIVDKTGQCHTLTTERLLQILTGYGAWCLARVFASESF